MKPTMLLIAEKPSERRDYEKAYFNHQNEIPYRIIFTELRGHVDQIPPQKLNGSWSFDNALYIPDGFKKWNFATDGVIDPKDSPFIPSKDGKAIVQNIINVLNENKVDYIGIGTDADIEGSFLANAFLSMLPVKYQQIPRLRLFIDDQSEQSVVKGLQHMHQQDEKMANGLVTYNDYANSGVLRGQVNYVMGIAMTRALTVKSKSRFPIKVGYVKAPIIQIVNQRYQQYISFKPTTFYTIEGKFFHVNGEYQGTLINGQKHIVKFDNQQQAHEILAKIKNGGQVLSKETKKVITQAPKFYKLTKLQGVMNAKYGMSLDRSLAIAQELYEKKKLLTYPRTESEVVGNGQADDFKDVLQMITCIPTLSKYAQQALLLDRINDVAKNKRFVNQKKVASHPAIMLNTHEVKQIDWNSLSNDEQHLLYEVALNNLLPFLKPKLSENTTIITGLQSNDLSFSPRFLSRGSHIIEKGWSILNKSNNDEQELPNVNEHDPVNAQLTLTDGKTKPLPLYTVKTLMDNLDSLNHLEIMLANKNDKEILKNFSGIGTAATRGTIINELLANGTLKETTKNDKLRSKSLIPTENGIALATALSRLQVLQLDDVVQFELDLTAIQHGKLQPSDFQNKYFKQAADEIEKVIINDLPSINLGKKKNNRKMLDIACPLCGSPLIETSKGYMCSKLRVKRDATNNAVKDENGHLILEGCTFLVNKHPYNMETNLLSGELKTILNGNRSSEHIFHSKKKKKDYKGRLYWDVTNKSFKLLLNHQSTSKKLDVTCPLCGNPIVETENSYRCSQAKIKKVGQQWLRKGCQFQINKSPFHMQSMLSLDDIENLISGKTTTIKKFYSVKKNKDYDARLRYDKIANKLSLVF